MREFTSAHLLPELAAALGRFSQAAATTEHAVLMAIIRLLPITDEMGRILFASNSASRNRQILEDILSLTYLPITVEWRERLLGMLPTVKQFQEDRNRLLHNRIVSGPENEPLFVMRYSRKGGKAEASSISAEQIDSWASEILAITPWISSVPHAEWDMSQFTKVFPEHAIKPW